MKKSELLTELKNFNQIRDHIEKLLSHRRINDRTRNETLLVFEALYNDMLAQGFPEDTMIQIWKT